MAELAFISPPRCTRAVFDGVLAARESPAAAEPGLYDIPIGYGLDPAVALAFFEHESTFATRGLARFTKSWGNNRKGRGRELRVEVIPGRGPFAFYATFADALHVWCVHILHGYIGGDLGFGVLDTVEQAIPVYAPADDNNKPAAYIAAVRRSVARWQAADAPAMPDSIHYPHLRVDGFAMDVRQWRTVAAFRAHLTPHDPAVAAWAAGLTYHHTVAPTAAMWRGPESVLGQARWFRHEVDNGKDKPRGGWTSGPHLYIAGGSPNPAHDGIWQLTPLDRRGTHAGPCNDDRWGIEVVGSYDTVRWPADVAALAIGAGAALLDWRGLDASPATVKGHRECNSPKTCPGRAISMDAVIRALRAGAL